MNLTKSFFIGLLGVAVTACLHASNFVYTGSIQTWAVAQSGLYNITAAGASGGSTSQAAGGKGALLSIEAFLNAGDSYSILVGGVGGLATFNGGAAGGGGGGTFIVGPSNVPLLISGGGGGAASGVWDGGFVANGVDASPYNVTSGQNGTSIFGSWSVPGVGGTAGSGGTKPGSGGAGGGGFLTNGQGSSAYAGQGGASYLNGGAGGMNISFAGGFITNVQGGFGGGAGAGIHINYEANGGGGGGYSGGGGSNSRGGAGGGGGNFYDGELISAGVNSGNGYATIELVSPATVPDGGSTGLMLGLALLGICAVRRKR
jgi:hypothetical protein